VLLPLKAVRVGFCLRGRDVRVGHVFALERSCLIVEVLGPLGSGYVHLVCCRCAVGGVK